MLATARKQGISPRNFQGPDDEICTTRVLLLVPIIGALQVLTVSRKCLLASRGAITVTRVVVARSHVAA